ncbi:MAG: type II secretion system F family protein [Marmoricola sp.]
MSFLEAVIAAVGLLLAGPQVARLTPWTARVPRGVGPAQAVVAIAATCLLVLVDLSPLLVVVAVGSLAAGLRAMRRRSLRREADQRSGKVLAACEGLAADLSAGLAPLHALRTMAEEWAEMQPVAHAAEIGADVPAAFRSAAGLPGAGMLRVVASAWSVSQRSGAGLSTTIALAAETIRAEQATARVVATELSAALATARLLVLLPVGVLLLGRGMGGDPVAFLLRSTAGQICLIAGLALAWSGSVWLERVADQVEPV